MDKILERLSAEFSWERMSAFVVDQLLPDVAVAGILLVVYLLVWRVVRTALRAALARSPLDLTAQHLIERVLRMVVVTLALISVLKQFGFDTAGVLASMGIVGLTLGFAARDTLSNLISGLFVLWDRPFVIGDLVEIDGVYGEVKVITLRTTRLVTVDGKMLAIPNGKVANTTVASYTNFPNLRIDIPVTVGVSEDLGRARSVLLALLDGDARYLASPAPVVVVKSLNDYNVELELRAWLVDERLHIPARLELRERAFEALRAAKVEMPFETIQLVSGGAPAVGKAA